MRWRRIGRPGARRSPCAASCATISHGAMVVGGWAARAQRMVSPPQHQGGDALDTVADHALAAHRLEAISAMRMR